MAQVSLKNVSKVYTGGYAAVSDLSLDISDGEFVALVGPSGCGKTTTLRMIAGLEDISSGSISIGGRVVNDVHPRDRDIAMVFQNYALYPHMTVEKNMSFALRMRKVPKDEIRRRVGETARILGIQELLDRKPRQLSGGQRQRVAVGRAIVREPKAFLFDEPLSNLDAKLRVATRAELKALHQRLRTTTVYVTHDQEEAMTLGDRIVVMSKGVIQQVGPPLEVYRTPANRFVASFIGTPPMNFLDGVLERTGSGPLRFRADAANDAGEPLAVAIPPASAPRLDPWAGKRVVLGIRPQSLRLAADAGDWILKLAVAEPLGDTMDLTCQTAGGERLVARTPARDGLKPGMNVRFSIDAAATHLFEPGEFGRCL